MEKFDQTLAEIGVKGVPVLSRGRPGKEEHGCFTGGKRRCPAEVCNGYSYGIRWADGSLTYVCGRQIGIVENKLKLLP